MRNNLRRAFESMPISSRLVGILTRSGTIIIELYAGSLINARACVTSAVETSLTYSCALDEGEIASVYIYMPWRPSALIEFVKN